MAAAASSSSSPAFSSTSDLLRAHILPRVESCRGSSLSRDSEVFGVDPADLLPRRQPAASSAGPRRSSAGPRRTEASSSALPRTSELIKNHLLPRLASGEKLLDSHFIHDADVYGRVPAELTADFASYCSSGSERSWYFFSPVHRKDSGKRRKRTLSMSDGWWHSDHPPKEVIMRGRGHMEVVVGYEQTLAFCTKNTHGKAERSGWMLKELTADPDGVANLAICKLYKRPARRSPAAEVEEPAIQEEEEEEEIMSNGEPRVAEDLCRPREVEGIELNPNAKRLKLASSLNFDFHAQPTDAELITHYLAPRASSGSPLHNAHFIHEVPDIYRTDPDTLCSGLASAFSADGNDIWYFFNKLKRMGKRGRRKDRTILSHQQHWKSDTGLTKICKDKVTIGHRQTFTFMESRGKERTSWRMAEFTLHQGQGGGMGASTDEIVLSKIYCKNTKIADGIERAGAAKGVCSRCGLGVMMAEAEADDDETVHAASPEELLTASTGLPSTVEAPEKSQEPIADMAGSSERIWEPHADMSGAAEMDKEPDTYMDEAVERNHEPRTEKNPDMAEAPLPVPQKFIFSKLLSFFGRK